MTWLKKAFTEFALCSRYLQVGFKYFISVAAYCITWSHDQYTLSGLRRGCARFCLLSSLQLLACALSQVGQLEQEAQCLCVCVCVASWALSISY